MKQVKKEFIFQCAGEIMIRQKFMGALLLSLMCLLAVSAVLTQETAFGVYAEESFEEVFFEETMFADTAADESVFFEEWFDPELFSGPAEEETPADASCGEDAEWQTRSVVTVPQELVSPETSEEWRGAPTGFTAVQTKNVNKITLIWGHPDGVTKLQSGVKYYVYEVDQASGISRQVGNATKKTKMTVSGLIGGEHVFFVRAEKKDTKTGAEQYGAPSDFAEWTVEDSALWAKKPSLSLSQTAENEVLLSFTVKEPAQYYDIRQKSGGKWTKIDEVWGDGSLRYEWKMTGAQAGEKMTFSVVPRKEGEEPGKASDAKSITLIAAWQVAPDVTATQTGDREVTLAWKAAAPAEEYRIFVDGKAAKDAVFAERGENTAVVTLKKNGKHRFHVQPWGTGANGKPVGGKKSATVILNLSDPQKLGAINTRAYWKDGALSIAWDSVNSAAESFDVLLWTGEGNADQARKSQSVAAGDPCVCTFSDLTPEVWYYCVRTNVGTGERETARLLSGIASYNVAAAPPAFEETEIWLLSDASSAYTAVWHPVWPADSYIIRLDGEEFGRPRSNTFELQGLKSGTYTIQVCAADDEGKATSLWSDPMTVHVCPSVEAAVSVDEERVPLGKESVFSVTAEGGKGDYSYRYTLILPDGQTLYADDQAAVYRHTLLQDGVYTLYATVTDSLAPDGVQTEAVSVEALAVVDLNGITYTLSAAGETVQAEVYSFSGGDEAVIAESVGSAAVTSIKETAFQGHAELNRLTVPESVTRFEEGWSDGCGEALLIRCAAGSAARNEAVALGLDYDCGGKKRALILAESYKDNPRLNTLAAPPNDAEALKGAFKAWGFEAVIVLDATAAGMLEAISEFLGKAGEDDLSVVTYSGHGMQDGSMPGSDCVSSTSGVMTAEAFSNALAAIRGRKVVIVDACYSGVLIENDGEDQNTVYSAKSAKALPASRLKTEDGKSFETSFTEGILGAFAALPAGGTRTKGVVSRSGALYGAGRTWVMVSAAADQQAWEKRWTVSGITRSLGFFSNYFTLGLGWNGVTRKATGENADRNADGAVSIAEAFSYASEKTAYAVSTYGYTQTAQASPENATEFAPWR